MRLFTAAVLANEEIMPATHILTLEAGRAVGSAVPGQFLHVRCDQGHWPLLRRPMSILRTDGERVQLMIRRTGEGSRLLTGTRPGDELDCLGPAGRGFELDSKIRNAL